MKVWVVHHLDYGDIEIWDGEIGLLILETPMVKSELESLIPSYRDAHYDFLTAVEAIVAGRSNASAYIDERLEVELVEVNEL